MITSNLPLLRVQKEKHEGRKLTYETISQETGLSKNTVMRMMNSEFDRIENPTIEALCEYFECGIGDLLEYQKGTAKK